MPGTKKKGKNSKKSSGLKKKYKRTASNGKKRSRRAPKLLKTEFLEEQKYNFRERNDSGIVERVDGDVLFNQELSEKKRQRRSSLYGSNSNPASQKQKLRDLYEIEIKMKERKEEIEAAQEERKRPRTTKAKRRTKKDVKGRYTAVKPAPRSESSSHASVSRSSREEDEEEVNLHRRGGGKTKRAKSAQNRKLKSSLKQGSRVKREDRDGYSDDQEESEEPQSTRRAIKKKGRAKKVKKTAKGGKRKPGPKKGTKGRKAKASKTQKIKNAKKKKAAASSKKSRRRIEEEEEGEDPVSQDDSNYMSEEAEEDPEEYEEDEAVEEEDQGEYQEDENESKDDIKMEQEEDSEEDEEEGQEESQNQSNSDEEYHEEEDSEEPEPAKKKARRKNSQKPKSIKNRASNNQPRMVATNIKISQNLVKQEPEEEPEPGRPRSRSRKGVSTIKNPRNTGVVLRKRGARRGVTRAEYDYQTQSWKHRGINQKKRKERLENVDHISYALKSLEESYVPEKILCREDEKLQIKKFLIEGISSKGSPQSLYISGVPGLGKTACLVEIIHQLQKSSPGKFVYHYVNGLRLSSPSSLYSMLIKKITGLARKPSEACKALDELFRYGRFRKNRKINMDAEHKKLLKRTRILVVDEIDFLLTKDQSVLYNVFDWPHFKESRLMIIGIANTLDLPQQLTARISSRMGSKNIIFKPYSSAQIREIISQRVTQSEIFDKTAIQFISKKVASVSSDIRKTLSICRQTIINFKQKNDALKKSKNPEELAKISSQIGINLVRETFRQAYESPLTQFVECATEETKILLIALYRELQTKQVRNASYQSIYSRYTNVRHFREESVKTFGYLFKDMVMVLDLLAEAGIIESRSNNREVTNEVILLTNIEDLAYSLRNEKEFIKISSQIESIGLH